MFRMRAQGPGKHILLATLGHPPHGVWPMLACTNSVRGLWSIPGHGMMFSCIHVL